MRMYIDRNNNNNNTYYTILCIHLHQITPNSFMNLK